MKQRYQLMKKLLIKIEKREKELKKKKKKELKKKELKEKK